VASAFTTAAFPVSSFEGAVVNRPPVADAGADQTVEATGPGGAAVTLDGSGSTDPDGNPLQYTWTENGSPVATGVGPVVMLALGTHTLTLTVDDGSATDTDTVEITVRDTTPPAVTVPADRTVAATSPAGATVGFAASAQDLVDGAVTTTCEPAPGTLFAVNPVGESTQVTCTATDAAGNAGSASFRVHVAGAVELTDDLLALVRSLDASHDARTKLALRLENVRRELLAGKTNRACVDLEVFAEQVANFLKKGGLSSADAARLTADARAVALAAGC
jgi:hypothetical protein